MTQKTPWEKLREPFPPEQIGTIPKGGVNLSYVGHAAVTDRLLQVDPEWTWEPLGVDIHGRPLVDENLGGMQGEPYGLWIKLTVCGVTRPGYGGGKNAKECISDAIRNAAMRFGVALDLWSKEDLGDTTNAVPDERPFQAPKPKKTVCELDKEAEGQIAEFLALAEKQDAVKATEDFIAKKRREAANLREFKDVLARSIATAQKAAA